MTTFRRLLTATALTIAASALAFGNTVASESFDGCVAGTCSVTLEGSVSNVTFQVNSVSQPSTLFQFSNFGALGINGTLTSTTFDTVFSEILSSFTITNIDTNTSDGAITAYVTINSTANIDSATTMNSTDLAGVCGYNNVYGLDFGKNCNTGAQLLSTAFNSGFQTISEGVGNAYNYFSNHSGPPASSCDSVDASCVLESVTVATLNNANYTGSGSFLFGIDDALGYSTTGSGQVGNLALTTAYNSNYSTSAEITYSYTINGSPEPTTMILLGGGLLSLGLLRKRIKS